MTNAQNRIIEEGDKVIITIGDSFVEGQGAYDDGEWEKLNWLEPHDQEVIATFTDMEHKNSWPAQLRDNHLQDYNIINLGSRGKGNRFAVKTLTTFSPHLKYEKASELTIVFNITQWCRYEFVAPNFDSYFNRIFETIWPHVPGDDSPAGHKELWTGFGTAIFNNKSTTLEFISTLVELQNFCKVHNANLVVINQMEDLAYKTLMQENITKDSHPDIYNRQSKIIEQVDFSLWMYGEENRTLIDELLILNGNLDDRLEKEYGWYGNYIGKENKYFTPCSHPTKYGHKLLAEVIYKHLVQKKYV